MAKAILWEWCLITGLAGLFMAHVTRCQSKEEYTLKLFDEDEVVNQDVFRREIIQQLKEPKQKISSLDSALKSLHEDLLSMVKKRNRAIISSVKSLLQGYETYRNNEPTTTTTTPVDDCIKDPTSLSTRPVDCSDIWRQGQKESGVYNVYPFKTNEITEVFCDQESDGGGWTVFLKRQPQEEPLDFNESWENFKKGFGNINSEFWLGNEVLHALTTNCRSNLRIDAEIFTGERGWAEWGIFGVEDEEKKYRLKIGQYIPSSTIGDSLSQNNNSAFTTHDRDNDVKEGYNCAVGYDLGKWGKGGWWYKKCGKSRPTAPLKNTGGWDSASWKPWNKTEKNLVSFKSLSMKFRPWNH